MAASTSKSMTKHSRTCGGGGAGSPRAVDARALPHAACVRARTHAHAPRPPPPLHALSRSPRRAASKYSSGQERWALEATSAPPGKQAVGWGAGRRQGRAHSLHAHTRSLTRSLTLCKAVGVVQHHRVVADRVPPLATRVVARLPPRRRLPREKVGPQRAHPRGVHSHRGLAVGVQRQEGGGVAQLVSVWRGVGEGGGGVGKGSGCEGGKVMERVRSPAALPTASPRATPPARLPSPDPQR